MKSTALFSTDEEGRLEALKRFEIPEDEHNQAFEDLVKLAAQLCATPVAFLAFVDRERCWLQSSIGLKVRELSRQDSLCSKALSCLEGLEVQDMLQDPLHASSLLSKLEPPLQFFAARPIVTQDGFPIGVLGVADFRARRLSSEQFESLGLLGRRAMSELESRYWMLTVARALSEQNQIRKTLMEQQQALRESEERYRAVAEKLQDFARQLERSNQELNEFASVAAHDLQEPLRKVIAFGERLSARLGEALDLESSSYLQRMLLAVQRMQSLIHGLLQLSRVTSRALPPQPINLNELLREVVSDLETVIEQAHAAIEIGPLPTIEADRFQMQQLFQNLLGNALKFRKPGVEPRIQVQALSSGRGQTCISIQDNGIGFDEKYLDRIFKPFERLHGVGAYEGTGMGLAICRKIVEWHGGSLSAASRPGEGSTFTVLLPIKQARFSS